MGNLGLGVDLGAFAGIGELGESEGDDEYGEDQVDGSADDEPQA